MRRLFLLMLLAALPAYSQSGIQVFVVATKTAFIWGEPVKVTATVRDNQGVAQNIPVAWQVIPSSAAKIAADGTVTPLEFTSFVVQAVANGVTGEVGMQVLPKKIVVKTESATMTVGGTQKVRADALDINDAPVPSTRLNWFLFNLMGGWDRNFPMASIDTAGNLRALVAGRLKVVAQIQYNYSPYSIAVVDGEGVVDINPPKTYRVTRVFTGAATRNTSVLGPTTSSPLIPTRDGFAFIASLDFASSALVEWTPNGINPIAVSGRAGANGGQPLLNFENLTSSHGSQFLFSELDTRGAVQISAGSTGSTQPLLVVNSPLFGAENTGFNMSRNSLAAGGMKIVLAFYTDAVTRKPVSALYRGYGRGLSELIVNTLDGVPGFAGQPFTFGPYGISDDGTAWFVLAIGPAGQQRNTLFRSRPGSPIEKILAAGDSFQNEQVQLLAGGSAQFFAANNGDLVAEIVNDKNTRILVRWNASDGWATPDVLRATSNGILWYEPAVGALINGPNSSVMLWNKSGTVPLLQLGDTSIDGSPVQQIFSATANEQGGVYAMIRTSANPMLIAQLSPGRGVILKAGDSLPFGAPPVISSMLTRASGNPFVIAGGRNGSIARLQDDGGLLPLVRIGDPLPNGKLFGGVQVTSGFRQASVLSDGRVVFGSNFNFNLVNDGIFVWHDGTIDWQVRLPLQFGNTTITGNPNAFSINSRGDWVALMGNNAIYMMRGSTVQKVMTATETPPNLTMTNNSIPVVDESGRVSFELFSGSDTYILQWDGTTSNIILRPGQVMPDGRSVRTIGNSLLVAGTTLVTSITLSDGQATCAAYNNGTWQYLIGKTDRTASGDYVTSQYGFDANNRGDLAFEYVGNNYNVEIAARIGNTFHYIQSMSDFLPDGALLIGISQLLINDDGTIFLLGVDDQNHQVIYKAAPEGGGTPYSIAERGGVSMTATQQTDRLTVGFATVQPGNNGVTPAGLAIFQFRQNGVLVTEAAVPATQPVQSGRIYAETNGAVMTGLAIANPNTRQAEISFYFTDDSGKDFGAGTLVLAGGVQTAAFLDQPPFKGGTSFRGTFTFTSDVPVGAIALRGLLNERSEFLITTLPVIPLSAAATGSQALPYFADGGGWTTQILLVNPSDLPMNGTVQFFDPGSASAAGAATTVTVDGQTGTSFQYSIPGRSSRRIGTSGAGSSTKTGSVRVVPSSGSNAPSVSNVFSFKPGAVTVSEAGIILVPPGRAFRMYVEAAGKFAQSAPGSMQSGIAFANPSATAASVRLDVTNLSGSPIGSADVVIPANGQVAMFLNQISGLGTLPETFQGVVRVSSTSSAFSLVGLRARFNERGEFLITTTRPFDESDPGPTTPALFPHLAVGGGYSTQFILLNVPPAQAQTGLIRFLSSSGDSLSFVFP